jgi:pyruvate formate lyase activating enzyme
MRIGGFEPYSFCDYEGKLAAVVFTQGCNLRCPFCHNGGLMEAFIPGSELISQATVLARLEGRRGKLDSVVVSGGEPTLQPDLAEFLRTVREMGYAVKLDTNGTCPEVLESLLDEGLLDYIAMDIKAPWNKYSMLAGVPTSVEQIRRSMQLIAEDGVAHEFRTTIVGPLLNSEDLVAIRNQIPLGSRWKQQCFRPEHSFSQSLREKERGEFVQEAAPVV